VLGGQHHLGLREVGRRAAQLHHQFEQTLDGGQDLQILLLAVQVFLRDAQVLELADGVVRRQRFGEFLQRIQPGVPVFGFFLAQQVLAPEAELALLQVGAGLEHARHQRTDFLLQFDDRLGIALAGLLGQAGRQVEQLEQGTQHREVDLLGRLDVFELLEFLQRTLCKLHQLAGVDLVTGDRQYDVAGVDEAAQHGDQQVGFQSVLDRREILDVRGTRQQFAAVEHLTVALGLEAIQHLLRVAGVGRVDTVAIKQLQRIEHGERVLGASAAGQCAQRVADQLLAVGLGDQHREGGIFRREIDETLAQHQT